MIFSSKKERSTDTCYSKWKKPIPKDHILYYAIYIKGPASEDLYEETVD